MNLLKHYLIVEVAVVIATTITMIQLHVSMIFQVVSVLTVLRNGLKMKKMTEGNAFKNISGYEYIGNAKEANAKSLPADLYLVLRPAFDKEGNQLDQSWYAVYRKRDSISSAFADYVLSIR